MNYVQSNVSNADLSFPHSFVSFMSINYDFGGPQEIFVIFPQRVMREIP